MEWVLFTWKKLASLHKMARQLPELGPVLHLANLVASEMIHFIHQMAYYTTFEVMECGWDSLNKMINTAESLDEIIEAHKDFLTTLVSRALLDDRSRDILTQLRAIYDRILEFQTVANRIHEDAVEEWDARQTRQLLIDSATGAGGYGTTEQQEVRTRRGGEFTSGVSWEVPELSSKLSASHMEIWSKLSSTSSHAAMMMVSRASVSGLISTLITRRKIVD